MSLHDPEQACGIMLDEWLDFVAWSDALAGVCTGPQEKYQQKTPIEFFCN